MGTTSEELKKLYAKLGGKDPKVAGFSAPGEILNAINEIPLPTEYELPTVTTEDAGDVLVVNEEGKWDKGEAGGGLPKVTAADNGDVLTVVDGEWNKAAGGSGVVIFSGNVVSNKFKLGGGAVGSDIVAVINENKIPVLFDTTNKYVFYFTEKVGTEYMFATMWFRMYNGTGQVQGMQISVLNNSNPEYNLLSITIQGASES